MRLSLAMLAALSVSTSAVAQERDTARIRGLPRDVAREAARLFNETTSLRSTGRLEIDKDRVVEGDVAVLDGPVVIAGRVRGRVLAINSDVILRSTARIDGDLLVVGGEVEGRHTAFVGGEIRIYRQQLDYTQDGEHIVAARSEVSDETGWWWRWDRSPRRSGSKLQIASAGAYNRVEGLPINLGPRIYRTASWGSVQLDAYGVLRTQTSFEDDNVDLGHNVNLEVKLGRRGGPLVGGRVFDVVEPTEAWQLSNLEAGLSAFLLRRDHRDYYERRGGQVRAGFFVRRGADVSVSYGAERWDRRSAENPWTVFHSGWTWRPNPEFDVGTAHLVNTTVRVDTRNDSDNPWSGWYVMADVEHGFANISEFAPVAPPLVSPQGSAKVHYARGFMDFRRYNRLSQAAQLNLRLVLGGWLSGDPLPLQRRFSVDGPGTLPGYDFRVSSALNPLTCTDGTVPGMPGQCDRIALAQIEYRGDLHLDILTDWHDSDYMRNPPQGVWVVFMDAGRGWLVDGPSSSLTYGSGELPPLSTFRTDLGFGLDFDVIGLYVAKGMSQPKEPANFFVRIRHRF